MDFKIKTIEFDGRIVKLQIWDTAGQERYKTIATSYYKGAHGIIIVYDITNRASFEEVRNWLDEVDRSGSETVVKLLIGNKSDLEEKREVQTEEGRELANTLGINFVETSAKAAVNIDKSFNTLVQDMLLNSAPIKQSQKLTNTEPKKPEKKGWCW